MHDEDSEEDFELNVVDELELAETEMKPVKVGEVQVVYYDKAFRSINQIACKYIGKRWLKTCHPKKQTSNPYNGGKLGKESMEKFGYMGGLTKPDYWPSDHGWRSGQGCRHREPDHVKKLGMSTGGPDTCWR